MFQNFQFMFFLLCFLHYLPLTFSLPFQNSSSHLCHHDDRMALLHFKNGFKIDPQFSEMYYDVREYGSSYPKTKSWKVNRDCCLWDGVTCDSNSGHVIGLDLSCSQLGGIIHPNSTLFQLSHLQSLNLAFNYFNSSHIPQNMGHFPNLRVLNLSKCGFAGDIPTDLRLLSHLVSLDLTNRNIYTLKMPYVDKIMKNLTHLRQLHLFGVLINSTIPHTLANFSSLSYLDLSDCSLQGAFPSNILSLPHLRFLKVGGNDNLYSNASPLNNLSSSLEVIDFSSTNLSGRLPEYTLGRRPPRLRGFGASDCNLHGIIPMWFWNTTEWVSFEHNQFTGELPLSLNTKHLSQFSFLDLSNNLLKGPIPSWLLNLPSLKSLDLDGNQFTGKVNRPFPKHNCSLEALYLGGNKLSFVELNSFSSCNNLSDIYLSDVSLIEGVNTTFSSLNLSYLYMHSCNITIFPKFLKSQRTLLRLDLSNNRIQGEIPPQLVSLTFLEIFSVSNNQLTGSIPQSTQFSTFPIDSFEGNLGLCGDPLPKCGNKGVLDHQPTPQQEANDFIDIITSISLWEIILIGFVLGVTLGSIVGYFMLSTEKPNWFSRKAGEFEDIMMQRYKKQSRKQQRRT